jgi:hypothetical protein
MNNTSETFHSVVAPGITRQRMFDLICCGFEGGVGYWCQIMDYENPDQIKVTYKHNELPLTEKGAVLCQEFEDGYGGQDDEGYWLGEDGNRLEVLKLDQAAYKRGLEIMSEKYPRHFRNFLDENEDAETGDVFVQCALLGEIVYG